MKALNFKIVATVISVLLLALGIVLYVNGRENTVEKKEKPVGVKQEVVTETWYFTGVVDDDPTNPENYSHEPLEDKPCGEREEVICEIEAPANSLGQPNMLDTVPNTSQTVLQQITDAALNLTPNQTVKSFREE